MNKDKPWITLFEQESQRASANQFQISYATTDGGNTRISLLGFELDAEHSVTQVLFFKFGSSRAKLRHFETKISVDESLFGEIKGGLRKKVAAYARDFIADVEI